MWNPIIVNELLKIDGFYSAFEGVYDSNYTFSGESHDFWEMFYILDGCASVCADDRIYNMQKNELILHKPMELHKFHIENNQKTHLFIISFDLSGSLCEHLKNKVCRLLPEHHKQLCEIMRCLRKAGGSENTFRLDGAYFTDYLQAFSHPVYAQILKNTLENFLLSVYDNSAAVRAADDEPEAMVYGTAVRCINANVHQWLSAPEIAKYCGVSLTYLKNVFSKYAGMGIHKYYLNVKLHQAVLMLNEGASVTQTASALNFSSQNYFSVVFKRETGFSPTEYMRRNSAV